MCPDNSTILIVDDNASDLNLLSRFLKSRGFKILSTNNGLSAISQTQKHFPDIILLDIDLPSINGLKICEKIKSNSQTQDIPIIFVTGNVDLDTKIKAFQLGAVDYIPKPCDPQELLARIQIQLKATQMDQIKQWQNQQLKQAISQQKIIENKLRKQQAQEKKANYDLEAKVAKKTAELVHTTQELEAKNQELQRSNAELESFAYAVSHDLQAPLRSIKMFAQLLVEEYPELLQAQPKEYLEYIISGAEQMENLIHDLLAYSRAGKNQQTWIPVNLEDVVNKAIRNLNAMIQETKAVIKVGKLPTLMVNSTEMTQLFQNLISNGIKFCTKQPVVEIGTIPHRDRWEIFVKDNGIGIDSQYHNQIFQVFQRLHSEDDYPGTGIGLSICHKIVKHYGGKIWIESEPDQGSSIHFTLLSQLPTPHKLILETTNK